MDCSMPGFPVHHQLLEPTKTHVHWVGDAIQPCHPLSSLSPPTFNLSQHQGLFQWVISSYQVAKLLELQLQPSNELFSLPMNSTLPMTTQGWFPFGLTGLIFLQSKGLSRVFSSTTVQKHQFFIAYISLNWISPTFKAKSIDLKLNQCYKIKNRKVSIKVATKILIVIFPEWAQLSCCYGLFTWILW